MDEWTFWAGLANIGKEPTPWCVMDCQRKCDMADACAQIKLACGYDIAAVRKLSEKTLYEMMVTAALERSLSTAV